MGAPTEYITLDPGSEQKMQVVERRLGQMEEFLEDSMRNTVNRSKEMRNRLTIIESLLKGQQESTPMRMGAAVTAPIPSGNSIGSVASAGSAMPVPKYMGSYAPQGRSGVNQNRFRQAERELTPERFQFQGNAGAMPTRYADTPAPRQSGNDTPGSRTITFT